jgi:S-adenosylmethionine synthetase
MFEKVNPCHPDKVADRIAGAIVDLCYTKSHDPKVACEVLIGHGEAGIQVETSEQISAEDCEAIVRRIAGEDIVTRALIVPQDANLAANQRQGVRAGDNGLFKGVPPTHEQKLLTAIAASIYGQHPYDGKYIIQGKGRLAAPVFDVTICQSHLSREQEPALREHLKNAYGIHLPTINPLGPWTGGPNTDSGATNRKLGSDMGDGVTGGGLNGKDLSKCDVSVNIACYLKAVHSGQVVTAICSIGDENVTFQYAGGKTETETFRDVVEMARLYILTVGGFEKFSEWGLIRPKAEV